jgi:hypothetical protein
MVHRCARLGACFEALKGCVYCVGSGVKSRGALVLGARAALTMPRFV